MRATVPSKSTTITAKISIFWRGGKGETGAGYACPRRGGGDGEQRWAQRSPEETEMLQTGQEGLSPHQLITPEGRRGLRAGGETGTERDRAARGPKGGAGTSWGSLGASGAPLGATGGQERCLGDTRQLGSPGGLRVTGGRGEILGALGDAKAR